MPHSILLECVEGAGKDEQVQATISELCRLTQFRNTQVHISLDHLMPAKRDRWWCLLMNPTLPHVELTPVPRLPRQPVLADMFPFFPLWTKDEMSQLTLDLYETNKFAEFGSLFSNLLDMQKPDRTALHGCANQLDGCPCLCRSFPFSEARLKDKGLFAALIPLWDQLKSYLGTLPVVRHMHPWEMAVIHGVLPDRDWRPSLRRFSSAGLGQMASPIQSCWATAHLIRASTEGFCPPRFCGIFRNKFSSALHPPNLTCTSIRICKPMQAFCINA